MKKKLLLFFVLFACLLQSQSYQPQCLSAFYSLTSTTPQASAPGIPNTTTTVPLSFPPLSTGFAIGPAFSFSAPASTFWSLSNDTLWYFDGFTFIKSNHKIGNANAKNIGGAATRLYALDASSGQIYVYTGSGNASLLTTIASYTNGGLAEDITGDQQDNFYVLDLQTPQSLSLYNPSGVFTCSYSLSGISTSSNPAESFAITGNTVNVQRGTEYYVGTISGSVISFTQTSNTLNTPLDFASCPVSNTFTSVINSSGGNCLTNTLSLSAVSQTGPLTYAWSGPGISGAANTQSILINQAGVYTCTMQSTACIPLHSEASYTVLAAPLLNITGNTSICSGTSGTLLASGASSYTWYPGNSTASSLVVSPAISSIYTLSGLSANGCTNNNTVNLTVNPTPTLNVSALPAGMCSGSSSTLNATGATSYTWNPGNTVGSGITVNPLTSSIFTVTGSFSTGCSSTATTAVTVTQTPTLSIVSPSGICTGASATITATGATTYSWNTGSLSASLSVSPTLSTTYTVAGFNGVCQDTKTISLTVNSNPTVLISAVNPTICGGKSSTLTASGANSYNWLPGSLSGQSVAVSPGSTNTYTLIGTSSQGCTNTAVYTVTVFPTPTISILANSNTVCVGASFVFTASGASTYYWPTYAVSGPTLWLGAASPVVSTETVIGTVGSCTNTATVSRTVYPIPIVSGIASPSVICPGGSSTLTAYGASTYTWGAPTGTGTSSIFTTTFSAGNTNVFLAGTSSVGCVSNIATVTVTALGNTVIVAVIPSMVCSGSTGTLMIGNPSLYSYTWVPSGVTNTPLVVSPNVTTTYSVNLINMIGCSYTATCSVLVTASPTLSVPPSMTVCTANGANLIAGGANTYTWNPGAHTGSNITVYPTSNTIYTVVGMSPYYCGDTRTVAVYTQPSPTLSLINIPGTICAGKTNTLGISGADTYSWYPVNSSSPTITVNPAVTTNYSVVGTYTSNGCSVVMPTSVTVNTSPTISAQANPPGICIGKSSLLSVNGATSYTWTPLNSNLQSVSVSPVTSTTYTVDGKLGNCTDTKTLLVTVWPNPTLSLNNTLPLQVCSGSDLILSASGASTYTWFPLNITGNTVSIPSGSGPTYSVAGSSSTGCRSGFNFSVNTLNTPSLTIISSNSLICLGESVSFSVTGASTYTWNGTNVNPTITLSPTNTPVSNYFVVGTDTNGCQSGTVLISQAVSKCSGLEEKNSSHNWCRAFPNPNTGNFTLQLNAVDENTFLEIYNSFGNLIQTRKLYSLETNLNIEENTRGIYMLVLKENGKLVTTLRLIRE